ncbi:MAG: DUF4203 domain-containing protein, partial [Eubacterium sp.]|nr:DUF4203 domain-containing protein [Eubacterium sp.]
MLSTFLSVLPDASDAGEAFSKALDLIISLLEKGNGTASNLLTTGLKEFNTTYSLALAGISLVLALAGCFFGYKLSRLFMTLSGFFAGLFAGAFIAVNFLKATNGIIIICALVGGLIVSLFAYKIYLAGIFVLCFFLAFGVSANLIPLEGNLQAFVSLGIGFVVGTLAIRYVRPVIILSSAFACAYVASRSLVKLGPLTGLDFFKQSYAMAASFLVLFLLGTLVQFLSTS